MSGTAQNGFKQTIRLDELSCAVSRELRIAITGDHASPKWTHKPSWTRLPEGNSVRQIGTILTVKQKVNFHCQT